MSNEACLWVIVSNLSQNASTTDVASTTSRITELVDQWHSQGKMMLSGPFDNETSSMTVISANTEEAQQLFKQWNDICGGFLTSELYRWDAMPILSVLTS